MKKWLLILLALTASHPVRAGEPPAPKKRYTVRPADYRILVTYDQRTVGHIRAEIDRDISAAQAERDRRLRLSRKTFRKGLEKELRKFRNEMKAARTALREEDLARTRGDLSEARRLELRRIDRTYRSLEFARSARLIEQALLAKSLEQWRAAKREERRVAEDALRRLDAMLAEIERKEAEAARGGAQAIEPPHQ